MSLNVLSKRDACQRLGASEETVTAWHDRLRGPRDTGGRRLFTEEIVELIRERRLAQRAGTASLCS